MVREIDETCLILRNFPHSFSEEEIREFVELFDPTEVDIYKISRTAFAVFKSKEHTRHILHLLHQEEIEGYRLFVEFSAKNRSRSTLLHACADDNITGNQSNETSVLNLDVNDIIKRLYATAENVNVNQPPPPYLFYEYPKATRSIIDAISITLESTPSFYIQVLHLMNRMNLEPPFIPSDKNLIYESRKPQVQSSATQTDELQWQQFVRNKRKHVESGESELDSSSNNSDDEDNAPHLKGKYPRLDKDELIKAKQRNILKMQRIQMLRLPNEKPTTSAQETSSAFDVQSKLKRDISIKMLAPQMLDVGEKVDVDTTQGEDLENAQEIESVPKTVILSNAEIEENRIPSDQLKTHPLFEHYSPGSISNRLYIKNLAKDVSEIDLHAIYDRYLEENCSGRGGIRSVEIRLMTTGRMKGQAFITFDGPYLNTDIDDEFTSDLATKYQMIERALEETNGFILKGKPLIVQYGKSKSSLNV